MDRSGTIRHYISGVGYPANKYRVASEAAVNGASQELVDRIRAAEKESFDRAYEVLVAASGTRSEEREA